MTMKLDYFDHVYILSLPRHQERLTRITGQLCGLVPNEKITVMEAVDGEQLPAPAYWQQGNGSWGCLQSHVRVLQTIWHAGHKSALILEDDAVFDPAGGSWLESFFARIPTQWGQLYLGGQHQHDPEIKDGYLVGKSVNRTHAYAVQRDAIPKILQHILHAPDYMENSYRHVDHQLEAAHRRAEWPVICPEWWAFGQGENMSAINGRHHPEKWWDWLPGDMRDRLPWVIVGPETSDSDLAAVRSHIHLGWTMAADGRTDAGMQRGMKRRTRDALRDGAKSISEEAWGMRRLPAIAIKNETQRRIFIETIAPEVMALDAAAVFNMIQWAEVQQ
jgi:hypothetical protein